MHPVVFAKFQELIHSASGICLGDNKIPLLSARIAKRMRCLGIAEYDRYFDLVTKDGSQQELTELLNAISTNVTHFFRESHHFQTLANMVKNGGAGRNFKIWCAAAATGEEPYSIAFTLRENLPPRSNFKILASDISTKALSIAKQGIYRAEVVNKLNPDLVRSNFQISIGGGDKVFRVNSGVRERIEYRRINLAKPSYPVGGNLDFIFCRNVMIYFDDHLRRQMLHQFGKLLKPGGHLFVGTSESIFGKNPIFKNCGPSVYQKDPGSTA